jgi:hypothetical protein
VKHALPALPPALAAALAFAAPPAAQSPPPTGPVSVVGTVNQGQSGGPAGEQRIGAFCAPTAFRGTAPIGAGGVGLGGSICWWSEAIHPTATPLTQYAAGTCFVFFLVAPFQFSTTPFPGAAPGHDQVFVPPLMTLVLAPPWLQVLTSGGGGAAVPPGGYDRWLLTLDVPVNTALLGSVWASQALRLDPTTLQLYFSDEHIVQVW